MKIPILLIVTILFLSSEAYADAMKVKEVIDGNTFETHMKVVHLWGVDAPSLGSPSAKAAKLFLEVLLNSESIHCNEKIILNEHEVVMRCFDGNSDLSSNIIYFGMGSQNISQAEGTYEFEELEARKNRRGIWKD